jgi:hypothetical protein
LEVRMIGLANCMMMMKMRLRKRKRKRKSRKVEDGVGVDGLVGFDLYSSAHFPLLWVIIPATTEGRG